MDNIFTDEFYLWADNFANINADQMVKIRKGIVTENFGDMGKLIEKIKKIDGITENIRRKCSTEYDIDKNRNLREKMKINGVKFITIENNHYPKRLKEIYDPPYILYYYGDIGLLSEENIVSVVGSRKCSEYGKQVTRMFVKSLSENGVVIASGLAYGIDSLSHRQCIDSGGKTIAVLGTAINRLYPKNSYCLFSDILKSGGLVISEHNIDKETGAMHFARRNRVIAGISKSVLVTEARKKSGSLITAHYALDCGRNIYAVPGNIFYPSCEGCNNLISEGAAPALKPEELLNDLEVKPDSLDKIKKLENKKNTSKETYICGNIDKDRNNRTEISDKHSKILKLLESEGALAFDEIIERTELDVTELTIFIQQLCFNQLIVEIGTNKYAPNTVK